MSSFGSRAMSPTSPMSPARGAATLCVGDVGDIRDIAEWSLMTQIGTMYVWHERNSSQDFSRILTPPMLPGGSSATSGLSLSRSRCQRSKATLPKPAFSMGESGQRGPAMHTPLEIVRCHVGTTAHPIDTTIPRRPGSLQSGNLVLLQFSRLDELIPERLWAWPWLSGPVFVSGDRPRGTSLEDAYAKRRDRRRGS